NVEAVECSCCRAKNVTLRERQERTSNHNNTPSQRTIGLRLHLRTRLVQVERSGALPLDVLLQQVGGGPTQQHKVVEQKHVHAAHFVVHRSFVNLQRTSSVWAYRSNDRPPHTHTKKQ